MATPAVVDAHRQLLQVGHGAAGGDMHEPDDLFMSLIVEHQQEPRFRGPRRPRRGRLPP